MPGKSHEERNLVSYSPWGCKVSDMTKQPILSLPPFVISMMNCAGIILSKICETEKNTMIYIYVESKLYEHVEREYKFVIFRAFGQGK